MISITEYAKRWAALLHERAIAILVCASVITVLSFYSMSTLSVSTRLEELMPENARSVQTLNEVLEKTGSFASVQIVTKSDNPDKALDYLKLIKPEIDKLDWVDYSQFSEDIELLMQHKLLMLDTDELLDLEKEVEDALPVYLARRLSEAVGADVSVTLREGDIAVNSKQPVNQDRIDDLTTSLREPPEKERLFTAANDGVAVLVVWPKPGYEGLAASKRLVDDARRITLVDNSPKEHGVEAGVAGRIANKVAQFNAVISDLGVGLASAITLIALLIGFSFRSFVAVPLIIIPLALGLLWTLGLTAIVIGGLNLITIFLVLILFGLGIDFGIHNFSRYREERANGAASNQAIETIVLETGAASAIAAFTTSFAFLSLTLTSFRAFSEFGFIAGTGILLILVTMYSVFPALLVVMERFRPAMIWKEVHSKKEAPARIPLISAFTEHKYSAAITLGIIAFVCLFAFNLSFERNFKKLEASKPDTLIWATNEVNKVFGSRHDRAILSVDTIEELRAVREYFAGKIENDQQTPTIEKTSSVLDFVPPPDIQDTRLEIIRRLDIRANELRHVDSELYEAAKQYLDIDTLNLADLPSALQRTYLGEDEEPGFLIYIYNLFSMSDNQFAQQFYDDVAIFTVDGKEYASASEAFVFVEMMALMKADALKAILLVSLTTMLLVFFFTRDLRASMIILFPPIVGMLVTVGMMGLTGLPLSIMNMVILPSLIGIAVDNAIHIYHRYKHDGANANIAQVMNSTGRAAVLTTMTTLIGFGGLITASMGGLRGMGLLALIGFTACLIITWVLFPKLLAYYGDKNQTADAQLVSN